MKNALRMILAGAAVLALTTACGGAKDVDESHTGALTDDDAVWESDGSRYDDYHVRITRGQRVQVAMNSDEFDTYLMVAQPDGSEAAQNDDCPEPPGTLNSCVDFVAPTSGRYRVIANAYDASGRGAYTLTIRASKP